jgi:hypothetical protein
MRDEERSGISNIGHARLHVGSNGNTRRAVQTERTSPASFALNVHRILNFTAAFDHPYIKAEHLIHAVTRGKQGGDQGLSNVSSGYRLQYARGH